MSDTFDLVCIDLKLKLWIGQGRKQTNNLYSTSDASEKLKRFLLETEGYPILLVRNSVDTLEAGECKWFEDDDS